MKQSENIKLIRINDCEDIFNIMKEFNSIFLRPIDTIVDDMFKYAKKLSKNAICLAYKIDDEYCGYIIFYMNDIVNKIGYISQIGVKKKFRKQGIGKLLLDNCFKIAKRNNFKAINLEVDKKNDIAINFYEKYGFKKIRNASEYSYYMQYELDKENIFL